MTSNHLRDFSLIGSGGALGTGIRYVLDTLFPTTIGTIPLIIFTINMTGAFLLGFLLDGLYRQGQDVGWRRDIRLFVGTGLLGGFTTYSTFAVGTAQLLAAPSATATGVLYLFITAAGGVTMAVFGIVCAQWLFKGKGDSR
jgi:CrcB protein